MSRKPIIFKHFTIQPAAPSLLEAKVTKKMIKYEPELTTIQWLWTWILQLVPEAECTHVTEFWAYGVPCRLQAQPPLLGTLQDSPRTPKLPTLKLPTITPWSLILLHSSLLRAWNHWRAPHRQRPQPRRTCSPNVADRLSCCKEEALHVSGTSFKYFTSHDAYNSMNQVQVIIFHFTWCWWLLPQIVVVWPREWNIPLISWITG